MSIDNFENMNQCWYLAFVGRPNAGKSSLIRRLTTLSPTVGKKPGSTRRLNEYLLDPKMKVVDIPGWGRIHSRPKSYEDKIKDRIISFFETNHSRIAACVQVIDAKSLIEVSQRLSKKGIIPLDKELYFFLKELEIKPIVALNKVDKISPRELKRTINYFKKAINFPEGQNHKNIIVPVSAFKGTNLDILRDLIRQHFKKKGLEEFIPLVKVS
ncbi:MAG: GTP-binding protein EngB [Candidatus Heimdallarchaeota archaeon]|nr:GTP-binding protein EngB [Candidatus Heimdallarchaeota archaeon]